MSQEGNVYEYPNEVLRNCLGIQDAQILTQTEAGLTSLRMAELDHYGLPGNFDLLHLQAIHHYIFQDIYDWAGEIRTVDIGKGPGQFAHVVFLAPNATKLFLQLAQEHLLQGLSMPPITSEKSMPYIPFGKAMGARNACFSSSSHGRAVSSSIGRRSRHKR